MTRDSTGAGVHTKRAVFVEKKTPSLWFICGVIALILALGLVVCGVVLSQGRSMPIYESVYVPENSLIPMN